MMKLINGFILFFACNVALAEFHVYEITGPLGGRIHLTEAPHHVTDAAFRSDEYRKVLDLANHALMTMIEAEAVSDADAYFKYHHDATWKPFYASCPAAAELVRRITASSTIIPKQWKSKADEMNLAAYSAYHMAYAPASVHYGAAQKILGSSHHPGPAEFYGKQSHARVKTIDPLYDKIVLFDQTDKTKLCQALQQQKLRYSAMTNEWLAASIVQLEAAWKRSNYAEMARISSQFDTPEMRELTLKARNRAIAKRLDSIRKLNKDDVLVILGAGHLGGEGGVLDLIAHMKPELKPIDCILPQSQPRSRKCS